MSRREDIVEENLAAALGRPVRLCPNCGEIGAHWAPERLVGATVVSGYFTCGEAA